MVPTNQLQAAAAAVATGASAAATSAAAAAEPAVCQALASLLVSECSGGPVYLS